MDIRGSTTERKYQSFVFLVTMEGELMTVRRLLHVACLGLFCWICSGFVDAAEPTANQPAVNGPLSAEESLAHFQLEPGLRIEIVAAEPEVVDPVAIAFDADGRLWVVEMGDYPNGPKEGEAPLSRIRILEDPNGDGRFEQSRIFADKLLFVTGLLPWRGGAIVTLAGRVAFMEDRDGDGRADVDETWFTGFAEQNSQLRANHPTFGLDHHVYIANGLRGGDVIARKEGWSKDAKPASISGRDFRFDPRAGTYEAVSGNGQFGLTFDDYGNRFVCSNRNPCMHIVLEDRYLRRNPDLAVSAVTHDVSPAGEASRVFPISRAWTTSTLHAGQFTAACGVTIYRGDRLSDEYRGNSFTCDPTGNLVHRDVLESDGATFRAREQSGKREFLASPDEWFRPVNLANGPDGALYIVDMYRAVIEHPEWVPDELKHRPDERFGDDRGRIYRIVRSDAARPATGRRRPELSKMSSAELVGLLEHDNGWHRDTAFRLLHERQDHSVVELLEQLARQGKRAVARVHALCTLDGFDALTDALLLQVLLHDADPRVLEEALRLAEGRLSANGELRAAMLHAGEERRDGRLEFQRALSLGEISGDRAARAALAFLALDHAGDPWTRKAIASSTGKDASPFFERLVNALTVRQNWDDPGVAELVEDICTLVGSRNRDAGVQQTLNDLSVIVRYYGVKSPPVVRVLFDGVAGLGAGLNRHGRRLTDVLLPTKDDQKQMLGAIFAKAGEIASSGSEPTSLRKEAIDVLRHDTEATSRSVLHKLAGTEPDQAVRLAAIDVLTSIGDPELGKHLATDFSAQTPAVRRAILDALLSNDANVAVLLDELEAERIRPTELDPARWERMLKVQNEALRARVAKLYKAAQPADRQKVLADYQPALTMKADAKRGREVFLKNCTGCHRIGDLGVNVAPDIADSRTQQPAQLLTSILDPNRAIDNNYFSYSVVMLDGKVHTGIIASETSSSITLRQQENKTVELLRRDIEEIRSNGVSLMPVGLEKNITVEQMADLISFIKNWRYLDGSVPAGVGK